MPPWSPACAPRARSSWGRRTRRSSPGRTRPITTSTAGPRTPMTSPERPAEAVAAQRRSSPQERRRSTSVVTRGTASASRRTSAVSQDQADHRTRAADRPLAGLSRALPGVHPARTDRSVRPGPRADPADHRRAGRRRSVRLPGGARRSIDGPDLPVSGSRCSPTTACAHRHRRRSMPSAPRRLRSRPRVHASSSAARHRWIRSRMRGNR